MNRRRYLLALAFIGALTPAFGRDITAKSAIAIDAGSGRILWSKDADTPMYPASTTKIMTGMLLIEHCLPTDVITAPAEIETVKEASMHLKPGEKVTAHDMLYAIMLRSANDGCYAVAKHISGSVDAFCKLMNERAKQIGCTHTHFHNPNGLNDKQHMISAHDLALIGREAMKYEAFREVVKTYKYQIARSINQHDRVMVNHDKLLKKDPSAEGIKTGFTVPAGHCFVGSSTRNGFRVITVVMKSAHWQKDDEDLMGWAFKHFEKKHKMAAGEVVGSIKVPGAESKPIPVALARAAYTIGPVGTRSDAPTSEVEPLAKLQAPVKKGDHVGNLVIREADGWTQRIPVTAQEDVDAPHSLLTAKKGPSGSTIFFGSALFVGAYLVRGKARRRMRYYAKPKPRKRP